MIMGAVMAGYGEDGVRIGGVALPGMAKLMASPPPSASAVAMAARRVHSGAPATIPPVSHRPSGGDTSGRSPVEFTTSKPEWTVWVVEAVVPSLSVTVRRTV